MNIGLMDKLQIEINDKGIHLVKLDTFSCEIISNTNYKIYIIIDNNIIVYIGKTKQRIRTKLGQGFRAYKNDRDKKIRISGYGGYKWIEKYINSKKKLNLFVFDLGNNTIDLKAEAIEAEIVYLVRKKTGRWPEFQNEIHFHNNNEAKIIAQSIFNKELKGRLI